MPCIPMIHVATKWTHAFNQDRVLVQSSLQKVSGQGVWTHPPMVLSAMVFIYSIRSSVSLFNGRETFWLVMMPLGGGRAIITLWAADRDRGRRRGYQRSWEVTYHHSCLLALQIGYVGCPDVIWRSSGCDVCEYRVPLLEGVRIGEARHVSSWGNSDGANPDRNACHMSSGGGGFCCPPAPFMGYRFFFVVKPRVGMGMLVVLGSVSTPLSKMSANKDTTSSSAAGQSGKDASEEVYAEKSVDKLNVREFYERFYIPNGVSIYLVDGEALSIEKSVNNAIYFTKEQFNVGLRFPLPSLFKEFFHFTQIPPAYIHPNMVRVLMGCSILSVLFDLDLSLLEVIFIYSIKKGKNDIHSFVASLSSLQLVTSLPDSTKGAARGHVLVKGLWAGLTVHPDRRLPKKVVAGEHFVLKDLPFYAAVRKADARAHKALLNEREERRQEGTLRKASSDKRSAPTPLVGAPARKKKKVPSKGKAIKLPTPPKEVVIKSLAPIKGVIIRPPSPSGLSSVSSGSGHIVCLNGSRPSMPATKRLALPAEEATSVNQPGSPHLDVDVAGAYFVETLPPTAPPTEETGAESQGLPPCEPSSLALVPVKGSTTRRSCLARDLKSGLIRRLQDRFLETIEVSCSSAQEDHLEGSEMEMVEENPKNPVLVPDEGSPEDIQPDVNNRGPEPGEESHPSASSGGSSIDDAACTSASPFSYAELGEMLKRIPPGSDVVVPSAKMFEAVEMLVSGIGGMVQQRDLFLDLLQISDHMKAFVSQRMSALKKFRDDNEALRIELVEAKSREESIEARLNEAVDETAQLRVELEVEFAAEREELKTDYQKQVDEMYFFGYRCCMKKHGINRDVPSIPPGEEDKLRGKPFQ
ncbi:hypothetical protein CK203_113065 [Vitis vinifera]|uniref:Uncharacterized protein n=1 Tax=Vitis vinifera TaxID=29760 RepID=A0A438FH04_VITVI|nr:hypothetical protein CK203_113065 [Vitis vinifera]